MFCDMCKFNFLIISILFLLCACGQSQNVDWKELCESADMEAHKYCRNKSDTHFDKAIQLYDTVIKNSPEYRNKALIGKMELLTNASKYEEAVQIIADMSDTASVFSPVLTKTMLINKIMHRKAFMECDGANMRVYTKKNIDELEATISQRKDSIYAAISSQPFETLPGSKTHQDVALLFTYFNEVSQYDGIMLRDAIQQWEDNLAEPNEISEAFFRNIRKMHLQISSGEESSGNFRIKYTVCENNIVISLDDVPELKGMITNNYSMFLTVYYKGKSVIEDYEIRSTSFKGIPSPEKFVLARDGSIAVNSTDDNLILSTNMYVPYDDFGYDATIQISSDGEVFLSAKESTKR